MTWRRTAHKQPYRPGQRPRGRKPVEVRAPRMKVHLEESNEEFNDNGDSGNADEKLL